MEQIIQFQNDQIIAKIIEGKIYVAIRPLCINLGLDADSAIKSLQKDDFLKEKIFFHTFQMSENTEKVLPERREHNVQIGDFDKNLDLNVVKSQKSQNRNLAFLPLDYLNGWLFQIKFTNTMKTETKEKLKIYKEKIYEILYNHFFGSTKKIIQNVSHRSTLNEEKNNLKIKQHQIKARIKEIEAQLEEIDKNNQLLIKNKVKQLELF